MGAVTDWDRLVGYADRLSARPGDRVLAMVSATGRPSTRLVTLPGREPVAAAIEALEPPAERAVLTGAHAIVPHDPRLRPQDGLTVSTWVWIAPKAPSRERRALLATWGRNGDGWALALDAAGRPAFEVVAGGRRESIAGAAAVEPGAWSRIEAALEPGTGSISISHSRRRGRRLATVEELRAPASLSGPGPGEGPLLLAAERRGDERARSHLDGKLDRPTVSNGPGGAELVAAWQLGEGRGRRVVDAGPHGLHGECVNGPLRAVTGHNWSGDVHDWRLAPEQYGAMHFHSDAVDDLGWPPSFAVDLPASLPGGTYAIELSDGECEDLIPVAVRRAPDAEPAAVAVLLPTFTYLAYSCERAAPRVAGTTGPEDAWVERRGLRSLYDRHADGIGVYEASILRPLTQLRPGYRCPQHGGPHGLGQDLVLLGWLARRGIRFDLITDHDVDREGVEAIAGHRVLITGAHPEYASAALLDAIDAHLEHGGSLAYLGGNGLNGPISVDPHRPHVIELRRSETQGLAWQALPGEHHHASGAYGGDWRRRGRPEHRTLGVGLCGFGDGAASSYRPTAAAAGDPAGAVVFAGLDPEAPIGAAGVVLGGAAGFEVDAYDPRLGSPPEATVLASAAVGDGYERWSDDVIDDPADEPPLRADLVVHRRPEGGAVFAVGSIAWTGCLASDDDNPVSQVTANVLDELVRERPFGAGGA